VGATLFAGASMIWPWPRNLRPSSDNSPVICTKKPKFQNHHSCVVGLASELTSRHFSTTMIKEISQRILSAAAVCLWVVVVSATTGVIWASTVNGGISW
jgi:hypothetical protein